MLQRDRRTTVKLHRREMGHLLGIEKILCHICKYFIESMLSLLDVIKVMKSLTKSS
jgi:hypothetical protein